MTPETLEAPYVPLQKKIAASGLWETSMHFGGYALSLVRVVVLAQLLAPRDFGLFGVAFLALMALESFSKTGFDVALVQKKGDITPYLDTAWTVQLLQYTLIALVLFFAAPVSAVLFKDAASAPALVQAMALVVLLRGCSNIGIVTFVKELRFGGKFLHQLGGTIADFVVTIAAAVWLRNAWALVLGVFARNLVGTTVSYLIHPYRPRFRLDGKKAAELWRFGRWILLDAVVTFIMIQGDDAFLGALLGTTWLGFYLLAFRIANLPSTSVAGIVSSVVFPAYAKLQSDLEHLRTGFCKVLRFTAFLSIPAAALIFALLPQFVTLFMGRQWGPLVGPGRVLVLAGAVRSVSAMWNPLYNATGEPRRTVAKNAIRIVATFALIYPLTAGYHMAGTAAAVLAGVAASFLYDLSYSSGACRFKLGVTDVFATVAPAAAASIIAGGAVFCFKYYTAMTPVTFFVAVALFGALYLLAMETCCRLFRYPLHEDIKELCKKFLARR